MNDGPVVREHNPPTSRPHRWDNAALPLPPGKTRSGFWLTTLVSCHIDEDQTNIADSIILRRDVKSEVTDELINPESSALCAFGALTGAAQPVAGQHADSKTR